jgi:hypothetical protein
VSKEWVWFLGFDSIILMLELEDYQLNFAVFDFESEWSQVSDYDEINKY